MSTVNYAEVLSRLADLGEEPAAVDMRLHSLGLIGDMVELAAFTEADAISVARLRSATRSQGLSLSDRACLATGLRLGKPILTADRAWAAVDVGAAVRIIRP